MKTVYIKLTKVSPSAGPFNIYDEYGNLIAENVSREDLIEGVGYLLASNVTMIKLVSVGDCYYEKVVEIVPMEAHEFFDVETTVISTGCVWRHLTNQEIYNYFYGVTEPYIIEYPFAYEYFDEILQNVKDYTKVYRYLPGDASFNTYEHVEVDDEFFNKSIIYNGQQCTGILELVSKPLHNLQSYMSYPMYNSDSKTITYTKSDSFYQYNTFWDVVIDRDEQLFIKECETLSIDKQINQSNMNYGYRSFTKAPIRGKETRVRHMLTDKHDIHLVSRFIYAPAQISYK